MKKKYIIVWCVLCGALLTISLFHVSGVWARRESNVSPDLVPENPVDTFVVNTTVDEVGECTAEFCSLRQAITAANTNPGSDEITFNIPTSDPGYNPSTGQWTIRLQLGQLPALSDPGTVINAVGENECSPYIILDATGVPYGLEITGSYMTISGLAIENGTSHGIYIHGTSAQRNTLKCSYVVSNSGDGIRISGGAAYNVIGSTDVENPNVISSNGGDGIHITSPDTHNNTVTNNRIGTNPSGDDVWANGGYGIRISNGGMTNTIGLEDERGRNLISGNIEGGILISQDSSRDNLVKNNYIGTDSTGTFALGNQDGVVISDAPNNTIGPGNLISGNERDGVRIEGGSATYNVIKGNYIGTNAAGLVRISNKRFGVLLQTESSYTTIGGSLSEDRNLISGNGYLGDYPIYGGVGIINSILNNLYNNLIGVSISGDALPNAAAGVWLSDGARDNKIGEGAHSQYANTIAWNEGDGIYIQGNGTVRNTIGRNAIYSNDGYGINNQDGGNEELEAPTFSNYFVSTDGKISLDAIACPGCTVMVYSDEGGEGHYYEGQGTADASTGHFNWQGKPTGGAYTLVAIDTNGNTSEFSPSPVRLILSIDDALPNVVVNKLPPDANGPATKTIVEYVATIISDDPTLTKDLQVELLLGSGVLGAPKQVFYRDSISDYDGTLVSWTNPSPDLYRVTGINLLLDITPGRQRWYRRLVFRFEIPTGASPTKMVTYGYLAVPQRTLTDWSDKATLHILDRADEIIVTNRKLLYDQYSNYRDLTTFLHKLYSFAQGPPFNWSPVSVIYYLDAYDTKVANWDNTKVDYTSSDTANDIFKHVDKLIEDWADDSTLPCNGCAYRPPGDPLYLLIVGDDNVVPFYRASAASSVKQEMNYTCPNLCAPNSVLADLRNNNYYFVDSFYGDLSYVNGFIELPTGRLIGGTASDLSTLLKAGQYGPNREGEARAIVASACGVNAGVIAKRIVGYGYNVLNDTEDPITVDSDGWDGSTIVNLMQGNFQLFHHGNHADDDGWGAPPCEKGYIGFTAPGVEPQITVNHPIFISNGCRSGLSSAMAGGSNVVERLVHAGASAVMASTKIQHMSSSPGKLEGGEIFVRDFWNYATQSPQKGQVNLGSALRWTYNTSDAKTDGFVLYGVPWVTVPYRGTNSGNLPLTSNMQVEESHISSPQSIDEQTFVVTTTFDASNYSVNELDGFDIVEVEGMEASDGLDAPIVPLAEIELTLPPEAEVIEVELVKTNPVDLGTLNIPQDLPAVPIPGGDPGGLAEAPDIGVYPSQPYEMRQMIVDGYTLARIKASPLSYNTSTDQTTLYRNLEFRITYTISSTIIGLLNIDASHDDLAPGEPFSLTAILFNATDGPAAISGTLTLMNSLGEVVDIQEIDPFEVPGGREPYSLEVEWTAPPSEGAYSLIMELYHGEESQVIGYQTINVAGGRITHLSVPDHAVLPGQELDFQVTFMNRHSDPFEGTVTLSIYDAEGVFVKTLNENISVNPHDETMLEIPWDTRGMVPGTYMVTAKVTDSSETVSYGILQENFVLDQPFYLPLVINK